MAKAKKFTAAEMRTIVTMKHSGYKYKEIAEKIGRSEKSVNNFCQRYRLAKPNSATIEKMKAEGKPVVNVKEKEKEFLEGMNLDLDGEIIGTITPMPTSEIKNVTVSAEPQKEFVQTKTLDDFSSRDMIKKLYERGYRIEDGKLMCYIKKPVQINEILGI